MLLKYLTQEGSALLQSTHMALPSAQRKRRTVGGLFAPNAKKLPVRQNKA
jgi:hypothetical protein